MSERARGIEDFLSPLPQSPVPLEVLEKAESESQRIETITPLKKRHRDAQTFISGFTITFDGTTYGLRFEDEEWMRITTSKEADDVELAMEKEEKHQCDV